MILTKKDKYNSSGYLDMTAYLANAQHRARRSRKPPRQAVREETEAS
jgi:hypothetical protein